jgi:hypothetical protein
MLSADIHTVLDAASLLEVTEFHLFELAYVDWFGRPGGTREVEPFFVKYMFQGIVPLWVRQFARKILGGEDEDHRQLAAELGIRPPEPPPPEVRKAVVYILSLVGVVTGMILLASMTHLSPAIQGCYFPPCY